MNTLHAPINAEGALVDVHITLAGPDLLALRQKGSPLPSPVMVRALIDTGAEVTCLDRQVVAPLIAAGLMPGRFLLANIPASGGLQPTVEYTVGLTVLHPSGNLRLGLAMRSLPVIEQPLGALGYQALIGRDVLEHCLLVYDGPGRRFTLAF